MLIINNIKIFNIEFLILKMFIFIFLTLPIEFISVMLTLFRIKVPIYINILKY